MEAQGQPPGNGVAERARPDEGLQAELIDQIRDLLAGKRVEGAVEVFNQLHQAEVLVDLPGEQRLQLLTGLPPEETAEIIEYLKPAHAVEVSGQIDPPVLADILDEASPDVAADVLRNIPEAHSQETLEEMEEADEVMPLLEHPDDTAGGLMTTEYLSVNQDLSAASALDVLRLRTTEQEYERPVLVVDGDGKLVGSLSLSRLALARSNSAVRDIIESDPRAVDSAIDQEDCARLLHRYNLDQLPVIDDHGNLIRVIRGEDLVDVAAEEATEDMYRMAGVGGEALFGSLLGSARRRVPWLYVNLATAFLTALVIALFESTIAKVVALAVFLPVVPGLGGMGGVQTLTLVVRSMALGELPGRRGLRLVARELLLGLMQGVLLGLAVGLAAYLWKGNVVLGLILGAAMVGNMIIAGLTGAGIPLLLRRLRLDPAVSSAVFITTFTDVVGLFLFLGPAMMLERFL